MNGTVTFSQLGKYGRLGNSMFQIAATIAYAKRTGKSVIFPEWEYSKYTYEPLPTGPLPIIDKPWHEPTFHYTPIPHLPGDVDLCGYFQSDKHFAGSFSSIAHFIMLDYKKMDPRPLYRKLANGKETCAVHVRRGDYLKSPHLEFHGVLPLEYYQEAICHMGPKKQFIIFSDDPAWCRANLMSMAPYITVVPEGNLDMFDMALGAMCDHHIIANSSFSWWMAYMKLGISYKNHVVIAPKNWFGKKAGLDTKDLYHRNWIQI